MVRRLRKDDDGPTPRLSRSCSSMACSRTSTRRAAHALSPTPCWAPDLPGYEQERHRDPGTLSLAVADDALHAWMRTAGWDRAHLVGRSVSGVATSVVSVEGNVTLKEVLWAQ